MADPGLIKTGVHINIQPIVNKLWCMNKGGGHLLGEAPTAKFKFARPRSIFPAISENNFCGQQINSKQGKLWKALEKLWKASKT